MSFVKVNQRLICALVNLNLLGNFTLLKLMIWEKITTLRN